MHAGRCVYGVAWRAWLWHALHWQPMVHKCYVNSVDMQGIPQAMHETTHAFQMLRQLFSLVVARATLITHPKSFLPLTKKTGVETPSF